MSQIISQEMEYDPIAVGATRPAVVKYFDIPLGFLLPVLIIPFIISYVTFNPLWIIVGIPALTKAVRILVKNDHNRPRALWLAFASGAMFAERGTWGGHTTDPLANGESIPHGR